MHNVDHDIAQEEPKRMQGFNPEQAQIERKITEQQYIQRGRDNGGIHDDPSISSHLFVK